MDWLKEAAKEEHPAFELPYDLMIAAWENGYDCICRNAPALLVCHAPKSSLSAGIDCATALAHVMLAAPTLGIGTCWAGIFYFAAANHPPLAKALGVPGGHCTLGAMMLGYPKYKYQRIPARKPPKIEWI